jgi:signal peptidase II
MTLTAKKKMAAYYAVAIFFIAVDRLLKFLSLNYFAGREVNVVGDLLKFTFTKNYYIALSLPLTGLLLLIIIPILIFCLLYYSMVLFKQRQIDLDGLLTVISFCAISNYYDRLRYGFVIDYLDLKWFTVFNLADAMIVTSIAILLFHNSTIQKKERSDEKDSRLHTSEITKR